MEQLLLKDRANSLVYFMNNKCKMIDDSPEVRPLDNNESLPPMILEPSVLENSKIVKELLVEKEQDKYLIDVLKKISFEQAREIEKLKMKVERLQSNYEKLLEDKEKGSAGFNAIKGRNRCESTNE